MFYLRVAEEREDSFAPEARAHELLRERGVGAPEMVFFEPFDEEIERSVMITTEVRGADVGHLRSEADARAVLQEAGRDLALINGVSVDGFGWIRRDGDAMGELWAELPTYRAWVLDGLDRHLGLLAGSVLSGAEAESIREAVARHDALLDVPHARLAHGDFDATHIYQQDGRYTGVIDFGEIRGANPLYDLGHLSVHNRERLPYDLLPPLLEGYAEVSPLPPEYERRIALSGLFIAVGRLAAIRGRPLEGYRARLLQAVRRCLRSLE